MFKSLNVAVNKCINWFPTGDQLQRYCVFLTVAKPLITVTYYLMAWLNKTDDTPIMIIFVCSWDICRWTLKSSEIAPNFACSLAHENFFGGGPPKFWTGIIKSNMLPSTVQNFAAIGRWSSEISRGEKNLCQQNISPLRKLSLPGRLIMGHYNQRPQVIFPPKCDLCIITDWHYNKK